jgi:hypothetical protein
VRESGAAGDLVGFLVLVASVREGGVISIDRTLWDGIYSVGRYGTVLLYSLSDACSLDLSNPTLKI